MPRRPHWGRLFLWPVLLLGFLGCTVEKPVSPKFQTNVYVPMGDQRLSGKDLLKDNSYITGDTTGAQPLAFTVSGSISDFKVGSMLDFDVASSGFSSPLDSIAVDSPADIPTSFPLSDLDPSLPSGVDQAVMPPFTFSGLRADAGDQTTFQWLSVKQGFLTVDLHNRLSVPLGGPDPGDPLDIRLIDRVNGALVKEIVMDTLLAAGGVIEVRSSMAGAAMHNQLAVDLAGGSPGSGGKLVPISTSQAIDVSLTFQSFQADSVVAVIPAQSLALSDSVELGSDVGIVTATTSTGVEIPLTLHNDLPIPATAVLNFPNATRNGRALTQQFSIPARTDPSGLRYQIDLGSVALAAPAGRTLSTFDYTIQVTSPGSNGQQLNLGSHERVWGSFDAARIQFDSIRGSVENRQIALPSTETSYNPPEGLDQFDFQAASLELDINSTIGLGSQAQVSIAGNGGTSRVDLPLSFVIPPGSADHPAHVSVALNERNSSLLDLIHSQPTQLSLSGDVQVGAGGQIGTIQRSDGVQGSYTLIAPLRMKVGRIEHSTDPFHFTLSSDDQSRIRSNVVSGAAEGWAVNSFPIGMTARVFFAADSAGLAHPAVTLDSISVAPALVDPGTGRVTRPDTTTFTLTITPNDIAFFARDEVYAKVLFTAWGADPNAVVEITALDYVDLHAMLQFGIEVKP